MTTKAYSYVRFSTPEQEKGDSFRRQTEDARQFIQNHPELNLVLDDTLNLYDKGISAYKGANAIEGKLAAFIKAVEDGTVKRGSYLLVESHDRLSRDRVVEALTRFITILKLHIKIVILEEDKVFDYENIDEMDIIVSLIAMSRSHMESERKGQLVKKSWDNKRTAQLEQGIKITKWSPKWLSLNEDRTEFVLDKERVKLVQQIYEWSANGMGTTLIIKRIEQMGIEPWDMGEGIELKDIDEPKNRAPKAWYSSYIQRLLHDRAVLGECKIGKVKGEEENRIVKDYYPRIIDEELFYRVQKARDDRNINKGAKSAGRKGKTFSNLFGGIALCGYSFDDNPANHRCSGSKERMVYKNNGKGNKNYLQCSRVKNGNTGCEDCSKMWRYDQFETSFLTHVKDVDASVLVGTPDELQEQVDAKRKHLSGLQGQLVDVRKKVELLAQGIDEALGEGRQVPKRLQEKLLLLEQEEESLKPRIEYAEAELKDKEHEYKHSDRKKEELFFLLKEMQSMRGAELFDVRLGLHQLLKRVVDRIEVYTKGMNIQGDFEMFKIQNRKGRNNFMPFFVVRYQSGEARAIIPNPKKPAKLYYNQKFKDAEQLKDVFGMIKSYELPKPRKTAKNIVTIHGQEFDIDDIAKQYEEYLDEMNKR